MRIRQVWPRGQVAHLWANESQESARNSGGNFYFNGPTIFSYRDSYAVATLSPWKDASGKRIVIMRQSPYGPTTARHFASVSGALRGHPVNVLRFDPAPYGPRETVQDWREFSDYGQGEARAIARGDLSVARGMVAALVLHSRNEAANALSRVANERIEGQFRSAAHYLVMAQCIARASGAVLTGAAKRDHDKRMAAILANAPELPEGFAARAWHELNAPVYPRYNAPDYAERMAEYEAEQRIAADLVPGDALQLARALWQAQREAARIAARDAKLQASVKQARENEHTAKNAVNNSASGKRDALERAAQEWRAASTLAKKQKRPASERARYDASAAKCEAGAARLFDAAAVGKARDTLENIARNRAGLVRRMATGARRNNERHTLTTGAAWYPRNAVPSAWRDALEPSFRFSDMAATVAAVTQCASAPRGEKESTAARTIAALKERRVYTSWLPLADDVAALARVADGRGKYASEAASLLFALSRAASIADAEARAAIRKIEGRKLATRVRDEVAAMLKLVAENNADSIARRMPSLLASFPTQTDRPDIVAAIMAAMRFPGLDAMRAMLQQAERFQHAARAGNACDAAGQETARALDHVKAARDKLAARMPLDAETSAERATAAAASAAQNIARIVSDANRALADCDMGDDLRATWESVLVRAAAMRPHADAARLDAAAVAADAASAASIARANLVQHWRETGEGGHLLPRGSAYFRRVGDMIHSSQGAQVSTDAGARLWALIRAAVAAGKSRAWAWGEGPRVGSFHVVSISAEGSAVVGCHNISAREARAFAEFMQWPPFDK